MRIKKLHLFSSELQRQAIFYGEVLGMEVNTRKGDVLVVYCGQTQLHFHSAPPTPRLYHFAFLIPTGSLEASVEFAHQQGLDLLENKGEIITHFDHGRAIYFYDADRNILEFIERPLLDLPTMTEFDIKSVVRINEVGLPSDWPLTIAHRLCNDYGIKALDPHSFSEDFCWVGDHEGAIIVTRKGRNWLPTERPGISAAMKIEFQDGQEDGVFRNECESL